MDLRSFILLFASFHLTGLFAFEEVEFPFESHLAILAYPDDHDLRATRYVTPDDRDAAPTEDGAYWTTPDVSEFAPYPFASENKYRLLNQLKFRKVSPEPLAMILYDDTDRSRTASCNVTLKLVPNAPRLDWFVGWGLEFEGAMFGEMDKQTLTIECELAQPNGLIGRERNWK